MKTIRISTCRIRISSLPPPPTAPRGDGIAIQYALNTVGPFPNTINVVEDPVGPPPNITVQLAQDANGNIISTAQDIIDAVNLYHYTTPGGGLVTANLYDYPGGADGEPRVMSFITTSGGDDTVQASDYGVKLRLESDGSALQRGDKFVIEVGYYKGDDQDIHVNSNSDARVKINVTGIEALGETGASDNIIDTLQRLKFALETHDRDKIAEELPEFQEALQKLSSQMSLVGVRLTRNEFTYNVLESTQLSSTERMSQVEDLDLTKAITDLQTKQTAYQAVLASTALVTRLSLVDYIS